MKEFVRTIVGAPPEMFEYLEYMFAAALFLIFVGVLWNVLIGFAKLLGAK